MASPTLERLGFSPEERVVIVHADDLGMCHAVNAAFAEILAAGVVSCGSIMVPCPWFSEMAALARRHPEADLGVHLTLTSEWTRYRWGPVSTRDPATGLLDEEGYFWADVRYVHAHAQPEAAATELRVQVERALAAGIDLTHIDTHMGAVAHPALMRAYVELAREYRLPAMIPRLSRQQLLQRGLPAHVADELLTELVSLEAEGKLLLVDHLASLDDPTPGDPLARYSKLLQSLPAGLTHLIYYPARPGAEVRAIMGERSANARAADWRCFSDPEVERVLGGVGVRVVGYRVLCGVVW